MNKNNEKKNKYVQSNGDEWNYSLIWRVYYLITY